MEVYRMKVFNNNKMELNIIVKWGYKTKIHNTENPIKYLIKQELKTLKIKLNH